MIRRVIIRNVLKEVTDQRCSSKQWFLGAHSCRHRKTGSAYLLLKDFRISDAISEDNRQVQAGRRQEGNRN